MQQKMSLLIFLMFLLAKSFAQTPNTWTKKLDFIGKRMGAVGFSIGSKGYVGTGSDGSSLKNDFWEYDPVKDIWTQKANFGGTARFHAVGFSISNKGYIGTGWDINSGEQTDFWEYDPSSNSWTKKANIGISGRWRAVGFGIDNKGYIGLGQTLGSSNYDFWEYDPSNDTWVQKANFYMNTGNDRWDAVGFSIGSKGYIGTGADYNDFWEYNPTTNVWVKRANVPGPSGRVRAMGFSIGCKGYIGMGSGILGQYEDLWEYDQPSNTWQQKTYFGGTWRSYGVSFSIGNKGYFGLGTKDYTQTNLFSDFWEYIPSHSITTIDIGTSIICTGIKINVPFEVCIDLNPGNVFTAQLSDASGSFINPVSIGTLTSTTSGIISTKIPLDIISGTGYKIRMVSSSPFIIGNDNGTNISIKTAPVFHLGNDTSICEGNSIILSAGNGYISYQWQDNSSAPSFNVTTEGYYWVRVKNSDDCEATDSLKVSIVPIPNAFLGNDTSICANSGIELTPKTSLATFLWHDSSTSKSYFADKPGTYWVEVSNQCGVDSDSIRISGFELMIPNLITPNGDGNNETLQIDGTNNGGNISIYNRWGEKVYENEVYENQWKAEGLKDGVYFYEFRYSSCPSEKGWIHIIR